MDIFGQTDEIGRAVICPYCGSSSTELLALFGQQLLTVQYYCNACHTPFEHIKDEDVDDVQAIAHVTDHISCE